jgi:hypothetical protein
MSDIDKTFEKAMRNYAMRAPNENFHELDDKIEDLYKIVSVNPDLREVLADKVANIRALKEVLKNDLIL